jgi:hypothetical protein
MKRGYFDLEAYKWVFPLCCGILTDTDEEHFIHDKTHIKPDRIAEKALWWMYERPYISQWWAHNMGKYDGLFMSAAALRLGWSQTAALAGGNRVISLSLRPPGSERAVEIYDSYALVPSALKAIAEDFDLPSKKLFTESDYKTDPRTWPVDKLEQGCLIDCRILQELLSRVDTLVGEWGGKVKRTFSATALGIVKADLKNNNRARKEISRLPNHYDFNGVNQAVSSGYYGARVEVLHHMPREELIEYDVCSSYPAAMAQPLPWIPKGEIRGKAAKSAYHAGEAMVIEATVSVSADSYLPCLPYRPDIKSGVFFPTGKWRGWFPANELRYAEKQGVRVTVHGGFAYTTESPFKDFIHKIYKIKSDKNTKGALRNFSKLLLNGCYGKFGEKPEKNMLVAFGTEEEAIKFQFENPGKAAPIHATDERILSVTEEKWPTHAHYGIASYITAYARIALHRFLSESIRPAYCDSDSIHCVSWPGTTSNDLGALKVEIPRYFGEFFAPKIYRLTEPYCGKVHLAAKGFPVNPQSFETMLKSAEHYQRTGKRDKLGGVEVERMRLLKSQMRKGGLGVARVSQNKSWKGKSMKRRPLSDGATVAWTVEELQNKEHLKAVSPIIWRNRNGA